MSSTPSIFNDVIGPVMRGPSSSHTAASWRIARLSLNFIPGKLKKALIEFDKNGAWASNFREQGTALGMDGGLLNIDMTDDRMKHADRIAREKAVDIDYQISSFVNDHPNTVRLTLEDDPGNKASVIGVSLGGGSFVITYLNSFSVELKGDKYELLINLNDEINTRELVKELSKEKQIEYQKFENEYLIHIISSIPFQDKFIEEIKAHPGTGKIFNLLPVMPIVPCDDINLPFTSINSMLDFAQEKNLKAGELGMIYEKSLSGLDESELHQKMNVLVQVMENSIKIGLDGTVWKDRILQQQSHLIHESEKKGKIIPDSLVNDIIANVTAIMESKSAMEVIVANPTAGSCGTVAGVLKAVSDKLNSSHDEIVKAYFAAGIVGVYFAKGPGFAAEEHGCQVECGASAGMAAAGIVQLCGGSSRQAVDAASLAIQNMIGLVCDPVADRVEVPCLGKNVSAAVNAYASATMVLSGFDVIIPYDQVLETVQRVGNLMPVCHKCTGTGGLAITPAAKNLKVQLEKLQLSNK